MPTATSHSHFWQGSATAPPGPPAGSGSSYQRWMINTISHGSGFGALQAVWEWAGRVTSTRWGSVR